MYVYWHHEHGLVLRPMNKEEKKYLKAVQKVFEMPKEGEPQYVESERKRRELVQLAREKDQSEDVSDVGSVFDQIAGMDG